MVDFSKVLVTGVEGMAGSYVHFGIRPPERELDVTNREAVFAHFERYRPTHVLHLAAETDLEVCERDRERAYQTNALGTYYVVLACRHYDTKMVYVSTAGVFDGGKGEPYAEDDPAHPKNVYGTTKLLGEMFVRDLLPNHLIARACWMFGGGPSRDKKFVAKIIRQLPQPEIKAVNDKFGSPTFEKDLIAKIRELMATDASGTFHLVNEGSVSRFDIAAAIVEILGAPTRITPVGSDYFDKNLTRADSEVLASKIGFMRPWREALREYLATEWKNAPPTTL